MSSHAEINAAGATLASKHEPLVVVLLAVCAGIALDHVFPLSLPVWCGIAGACLAVWFVVRRRTSAAIAAWPILLACLAAAGAWHHLNWYLFDATEIGRYAAAFPRRVALRMEAADTTCPTCMVPCIDQLKR